MLAAQPLEHAAGRAQQEHQHRVGQWVWCVSRGRTLCPNGARAGIEKVPRVRARLTQAAARPGSQTGTSTGSSVPCSRCGQVLFVVSGGLASPYPAARRTECSLSLSPPCTLQRRSSSEPAPSAPASTPSSRSRPGPVSSTSSASWARGSRESRGLLRGSRGRWRGRGGGGGRWGCTGTTTFVEECAVRVVGRECAVQCRASHLIRVSEGHQSSRAHLEFGSEADC